MPPMPKHREAPLKRVNPSGQERWVARYTDPDGKRRSAGTFKLKRAAQDAIDAAYDAPARRDTVGAYAADWTRRYPRSERTDQTNDGRIRAVLDVRIDGRLLRDWPLAEFRRRHAVDLVDHMLREQGRATTGATNILRALSTLAEDAITDELLGANPFRGVKVRRSDPRAVKQPREPRVWTWEQMHHLAACGGTNHAMLRLLADCGLRVGELFALRRTGVGASALHVDGSAWEGRINPSSREKNHDREIPIPPGCLALLRAMPTRIDTPWLFPTPGGQVWRVNNFYRDVWRPARAASGIEATPHDFRHSWCTLLRAEGIDPADLAAMAGHSVETATARYTHALKRSFEDVRRAIG